MDSVPSKELEALRVTYTAYKFHSNTMNLSITKPLWTRLDESVKKQINRLRQELRSEQD